MRALTHGSILERSGHSRNLSLPSVCVWQRNELTTSHRGDTPPQLGCLRSRQREVSVNEDFGYRMWFRNELSSLAEVTLYIYIKLSIPLKTSPSKYSNLLCRKSFQIAHTLKYSCIISLIMLPATLLNDVTHSCPSFPKVWFLLSPWAMVQPISLINLVTCIHT